MEKNLIDFCFKELPKINYLFVNKFPSLTLFQILKIFNILFPYFSSCEIFIKEFPTFKWVALLSPINYIIASLEFPKPLPFPTDIGMCPEMRAQKLLNFLERSKKQPSHWTYWACPRTNASVETDHGSISMPGTSLTQFHFGGTARAV